jgi:hypothetical protein
MDGDEDVGGAMRFGGRARETLDPADVGRSLKEHFEETLQAPLPGAMRDLLDRLAGSEETGVVASISGRRES